MVAFLYFLCEKMAYHVTIHFLFYENIEYNHREAFWKRHCNQGFARLSNKTEKKSLHNDKRRITNNERGGKTWKGLRLPY